MKLLTIICAAMVIAGCVTPAVTHQSAVPIDFTLFKTVSYSVHPTSATEYGNNAQAYGQETIDLFSTLLGKKLTSLGYELTPAGTRTDLSLDVAVSAVKPGSATTRFWIGFGAGRAVLLFDASFTAADGQRLAAFQGGRSHTEWDGVFTSVDDIRVFAATASVRQIETFMKNGGTFPQQKP